MAGAGAARHRGRPVTEETTSVGRVWRTRLSARLALAFFVPAVCVASLAAAAAFLEARAALRESVFERLHAATGVREAQFTRWLNEQTNDLRFLDSLPIMLREAEAIRAGRRNAVLDTVSHQLRRVVEGQQDFASIVLLSATGGRAIAASDPTLVGIDRAGERYFRDGLRHVTVQEVTRSAVTGRPTLAISLPVHGWRGAVVGVLVGEANLDRLDEVIGSRAGLGATGEAYLVDRFHEVVRGSRAEGGPMPRSLRTPIIDSALAGHSGAGVYTNYAGVEVIGVYRWLPRQRLALFAEMRTSEAFAAARRLASVILVTGMLAAIALAIGVTILARQIARPVQEIAAAAQAVAEGDLAATAPVRTPDEIGRLAAAFNLMTARLREAHAALAQQLRAAENAARTTEEGWRLLRAVIDHLPSLVAVKNLEGRYVMVNETFARMNGIDTHAALGRMPHELMAPETARAITEADSIAVAGETAVGVEQRIQVNGEERVYLVSRFPLRDEAGVPFALGAVATDITERKRMEMQLLHQQKLEAVGRLAGGVAHDMNNLLTAVRCNAELLLDGLPPGDPHRVHLEEIDRCVRNGSALTRQLLTFSRAHVVRPSALDLNRLLTGMQAMLRRYVGTGIEMQFALDPAVGLVHADEGQLEQVLLNLLSNASDAMLGGGTATVSTANVVVGGGTPPAPELPPGEYVRLSIRDTGTGIEPASLPLLFEPFYTTKEPGRGTGLGLSTAYAIVHQARGAIAVESTLGVGTTFSVYLPRYQDAELPAPTAPAPALPAPRADTLLVVDDEPSVRVAVRRLLARHGYRTLEAESAEDALALFRLHEDAIALVLTDVFMPGMGGHQLAAALLALRPELPVVYMSGYTADEVVRRGLMDASTSFLQKPFDRHSLLGLVDSRLARPTAAPA